MIIMMVKELHRKLGVLAEFFPPSGVSGGACPELPTHRACPQMLGSRDEHGNEQ